MKPTMEMIEAGAQAMMPIQEKSAFPNNLDLSRAAITAALAAMPAPEVKVKTLEWEQNEGDDWCFTQYTSDTFGGSYCIEERPTGDFDLHIPGAAVSERFSSLAEAKSAAQKDHEARIRAALTHAPDLAAENERLRAALDARKTPTVWTVEFTTPDDDEDDTVSFAFADKEEFAKFLSAMRERVTSIFERDCVTAEDAIGRSALERKP